jgi:cytochrome c2
MRPRTCLLASLFLASLAAGGCAKKEEPKPAAATGDALTMAPREEEASRRALEILNQKCTSCHTNERFSAKAFTPDEWNAVLQRMVGKGAQLSGDELDVLRHMRKTP